MKPFYKYLSILFVAIFLFSCANKKNKTKAEYYYFQFDNNTIKIGSQNLINTLNNREAYFSSPAFKTVCNIFYIGNKKDTIIFGTNHLSNNEDMHNTFALNQKSNISFYIDTNVSIPIIPFQLSQQNLYKETNTKEIKSDSSFQLLPNSEKYIANKIKIVKLINNDSKSFNISTFGNLTIIKQIQMADSSWQPMQSNQGWIGCILNRYLINSNEIAMAYLINYDGDTTCKTRYIFKKQNAEFYSNVFNEKIYKSQIQYFIAFKKYLENKGIQNFF